MKKFLLSTIFSLCFLGLLIAVPGQAQEVQTSDSLETVDVYFFYGNGCPHCEKEEAFLEKVQETYDFVDVHTFEVWESAENRDLLQSVAELLRVDVQGVPFTVIGSQYMSGYLNDETSGDKILQNIAKCVSYECEDVVEPFLSLASASTDVLDAVVSDDQGDVDDVTSSALEEFGSITLPVVGEINPATFSLPLLTIIIGGLDGFNPCAMWVLIFLISLLVNMANKRRMWILGSAFIAASAFVYFLFLSAWLNFFLFIGFILWVRLIIGIVALISGGYNIREYFVNKEAVCKVTNNEKRKNIFDRLKKVTQNKRFILALGGIILLAFAVNLVELVCSAGLPAVYTQILALSDLPSWQHYLYLLLYIFVFMLDDLFVFIISMITLQITGITTKYTRWSYLIGGVLMLILGALLILKPEILLFG